MKLCWLTDIHLNFLNDAKVISFLDEVHVTNPDAILIGGDIGDSNNLGRSLQLFTDRTGVLGVSVITSAWKELNGQACSAVIGHHWDKIFNYYLRNYTGLPPWRKRIWFSVKCPVTIHAHTDSGVFGLDCDGNTIGEITDTASVVFGDSKTIFIDDALTN